MTSIPFDIFVASGLEPVADAFKANFQDGLEYGAQFCAYRNGELILDLKGGWTDRKKTQAVSGDTLFSVYSSGKAMAAMVIAHLADQDRLGYNQLVATIWPEFAANGKGDLSVAQIMSHQAGLSGITHPDWTKEDWYDWDKTCAVLAAQKPIFSPASASGYHPVTYGFLAGEIARRTDKDMRSLGRILREDICSPQNIDVWIGLPESEHARCASMIKPKAMADLGEMNAATKAAFMSKSAAPGGRPESDWRKAEFAGSNCQATAKGLARVMQMAVNGNIGQTKYLSEDIVLSLRESRILGPNLVLPFDIDFAAGVMRNAPNYFYGPNAETVGHSGWGGSCVFADPISGLHGAYVMNRQDNTLLGDKRPRRLIDALYNCL
ncbi:serine hydrolase domain-containing protein [Hellea balneolensis]|uniref:serine hydrolase domain-containing protein n=1 Tax=Hellea balneolensis TaxID=287478 RepID=UPI0003F8AEED|nr:serine hydrolase domain-containing protein [Hellea balneolensis]